jgi:hypothetical protein
MQACEEETVQKRKKVRNDYFFMEGYALCIGAFAVISSSKASAALKVKLKRSSLAQLGSRAFLPKECAGPRELLKEHKPKTSTCFVCPG